MEYMKNFKNIRLGTDVMYIFKLFKISNNEIDILINKLRNENKKTLTINDFRVCKILNNEQLKHLARYSFGGESWCKICEERDKMKLNEALANFKI